LFTKASMPSFWSAVANSAWNRRRSNITPSASPPSKARFTHSLAAITRGREAADHQRGGQGFVHQLVQRHHAADQAGALGLGGVHHAAGEAMSMALALPTARGRRCVPPAPGMMPELDLGLAELGVVGGDDEVAHHGQFAAATQREAATAAITGLRMLRMVSQLRVM
jgi:hypothetical protein